MSFRLLSAGEQRRRFGLEELTRNNFGLLAFAEEIPYETEPTDT